MSPVARSVPIVIGASMAVGGLVLGVTVGGGWVLAAMGALIVLSTLVEGRYHRGCGQSVDHDRWQRTAEREIDSETGEPIAIWFDPITGARSYRPLEDGPPT